MSAGDAVTYVYEPFFEVSVAGTDIQNIINRNDVTASNLVRQNLTDLTAEVLTSKVSERLYKGTYIRIKYEQLTI